MSEDDMTYTYDMDLFSDLHKDAYGVRPSSGFMARLKDMTKDELQAEWDQLLLALETSIEQEQLEYDLAEKQLTADIQELLDSGHKTVKSCIDELHRRHASRGNNEYLDFLLNVRYGTTDRLLSNIS